MNSKSQEREWSNMREFPMAGFFGMYVNLETLKKAQASTTDGRASELESPLSRRAACGAAGAALLATALGAQPSPAAAQEVEPTEAEQRGAGQADTTITDRVYLDIGEPPIKW